ILILIGPDKAPANRTVLGERTADIQFATIVVPASAVEQRVHLELFGRLLAHKINCAARCARGAVERVGAAQDLDAIEHSEVKLGCGEALTYHASSKLRAVAVDLKVCDRKTSGIYS